MSNKRKLSKDKTVHASFEGQERALCSKNKTKRVTQDPEEVTCLACGRLAQALLERLLEEELANAPAVGIGRQEAALASRQPPHWTLAKQKVIEG